MWDSDFSSVAGDIAAFRKYGAVTIESASRARETKNQDAIEIADAFVMKLGFNALGDGWIKIEAMKAAREVESILHRDMAYASEMMPAATATALARRFVELFESDAIWLTNREDKVQLGNGAASRGSEPLTAATFNAAFLVVGSARVAILLVEDED